MRYPAAVNLPFNAEIIKNRFVHRKPGEVSHTGSGRWLLLQGETLLLEEGELFFGDFPGALPPEHEPILFGEWDGAPVRVAVVGESHPLPATLSATPLIDLPEELLTLSGLARQIVHWDRMSRACSRCGGRSEWIGGSWGKRCTSCGYQHFPHIHPCAIVLVRKGDEVLLGRKAEWPAGRYSLVAGFADFGESLEECAAREVYEETGITAGDIRYVGSQSWPFPSQLMAGFVAEYQGGEIRVDGDELEDARWFKVGELPALPPSRSIARWIIDRFAVPRPPVTPEER